MQKLNTKQKNVLEIIINKQENWSTYFDQLFIELIPYAYGVARKLDEWSYRHFLERDDFLSYAFIVYNSLIRHYQRINKSNSENFLTVYGIYLYRMYRYIIKKYNDLHGEKILSITIPDYQIVGIDDGESTELETINHLNMDLDTFISKDIFLKKTYNLLKSGYSITETAQKLNVSRSSLYQKISSKKAEFKKYQKFY